MHVKCYVAHYYWSMLHNIGIPMVPKCYRYIWG